MNDNRLPDAIIGRLSRVRTLESQLMDRLAELLTEPAIDRAPGERFTRLLALAASHRLALDEFAGLRGAELNRVELTGVHRDGVPPAVRAVGRRRRRGRVCGGGLRCALRVCSAAVRERGVQSSPRPMGPTGRLSWLRSTTFCHRSSTVSCYRAA